MQGPSMIPHMETPHSRAPELDAEAPGANVQEMDGMGKNRRRALELDGEAPGPHVLEIGGLEPTLETTSSAEVAELDVRNEFVNGCLQA